MADRRALVEATSPTGWRATGGGRPYSLGEGGWGSGGLVVGWAAGHGRGGAVGVVVGVGDGVVEVGEEVVLGGEAVEGADGAQEAFVFGAWTFEEHGDVPVLEVLDDLAEGLGAGGVEDLQVGEAQDDDLDVCDLGEVGEEALGGTEEQGAVDAVRDDVFAQQVSPRCRPRPRWVRA